MAIQQNISRDRIWPRQTIEHERESSLSNGAAGLVNRRERNGQETSVGDVIDADDANIRRNSKARGEQALHCKARRSVIRANQSIGPVGLHVPANVFLGDW